MDEENGVEQEPQPNSLAVAFDIGTTFSGAAHQLTGDNEASHVVDWPDSVGDNQDRIKVPSILYLDDERVATGWGYKDENGDVHVLEWFKLTLVSDNELPPHLRDSTKLKETRQKMRDLGVSPTQVMAQYMDMLATHSFNEIKDNIGKRAFESIKIHVVITVPAIWGKSAIDKMTAAAGASILQSRSRLITYEFLSEPQAAVEAYESKLKGKLQVGEIITVVDLGGGTVDVITYRKVGEGKLEEVVPGDGDLCGAIILDEAFEKLFLSKLPRKYRNIKDINPQAWKAIMSEQWHRKIKKQFVWKGKNQLVPVVLTNLDRRLDVQLHEDEIRDVFESSVMPKILDLVKKQIEAVKRDCDGQIPQIILPVGGFGRCPYVLQRLREVFNPSSVGKKRKRGVPEIEIHSDKGETPWGAVCKGACHFGIRALRGDRLVKTRLARCSVGYEEFVHASAEKGGKWHQNFDNYVKPVMVWVVKKGDQIPNHGMKSVRQMYLPCPFDGTGTRCEESQLYAYDGDSPPDEYDENDPGFREYGMIKITATRPIEQLPKQPSNSGDMPYFPYNLHVNLVAGSVDITAVSALPEDEGKVVGHVGLIDKLEGI